MKYVLCYVIFLLSAQTAFGSACKNIEDRLGQSTIYEAEGIGFGARRRIKVVKTDDPQVGVIYQVESQKATSRFKLSDRLFSCVISNVEGEDGYYSEEYTFVIKAPNSKGECRIMGLQTEPPAAGAISDFAQKGLCIYPYSFNPVISMLGLETWRPIETY